MERDGPRSRGFLTCSARARSSVAPLLAAAEQLLLDMGWRTRVQRSAGTGQASLEERRRLRTESYVEVERATALLHVPAGAKLSGSRLHHALNHAVQQGVPVLLLSCPELRERLGIEPPSPERVASLLSATEGQVVLDLDALPSLLDELNGARETRRARDA